jgi:hypothetical protein
VVAHLLWGQAVGGSNPPSPTMGATMGRSCSVALLVVALAAVACGSSGGESTRPRLDLPPNDRDALAELFDPQLRPLGLRLTRGALVDTDPGYRRSDTGRHLAVYVEPTGEYGPAQYAEGVPASARVFLPEVFERWSDLETFDVCQEPLPGDDDRKEPPPVTQLYLTRTEARSVDWGTVTLADLVARTEPTRKTFTLYLAPLVTSAPALSGLAAPS